jgi:sulfate transport system ATP-binding protein
VDVGGVLLTTHRSLERRPVEIGEKMNVIVYRVYAIRGNETILLENQDLKKIDPENKRMESYLYGDGVYFTS